MNEGELGLGGSADSLEHGVEAARSYSDSLTQIGDAQSALERSGRSLGSMLTTALTQAAARGRDLGYVLRSVAISISGRAVDRALAPVGNALGKAVGGVLTDLIGGAMPFAQGGVVGGPALFPLGPGRLGLMGERGAEAILPLARGPDGRLGVQAAGGAGSMQVVVNVTTPDADSFRRSESQVAALVHRAVARGTRNL